MERKLKIGDILVDRDKPDNGDTAVIYQVSATGTSGKAEIVKYDSSPHLVGRTIRFDINGPYPTGWMLKPEQSENMNFKVNDIIIKENGGEKFLVVMMNLNGWAKLQCLKSSQHSMYKEGSYYEIGFRTSTVKFTLEKQENTWDYSKIFPNPPEVKTKFEIGQIVQLNHSLDTFIVLVSGCTQTTFTGVVLLSTIKNMPIGTYINAQVNDYTLTELKINLSL